MPVGAREDVSLNNSSLSVVMAMYANKTQQSKNSNDDTV